MKDPDAYFNGLKDLVDSNPAQVVALGEMGLDYDRLRFCSKETQKQYFKLQLELAETNTLPFFLHNRGTNGEFVEFLRKHGEIVRKRSGVVHSFDGYSRTSYVFLRKLGGSYNSYHRV